MITGGRLPKGSISHLPKALTLASCIYHNTDLFREHIKECLVHFRVAIEAHAPGKVHGAMQIHSGGQDSIP